MIDAEAIALATRIADEHIAWLRGQQKRGEHAATMSETYACLGFRPAARVGEEPLRAALAASWLALN